MKTKLIRSRGRIALILEEKGVTNDNSKVLAAMTLLEGTGCWRLVDVRLSKYKNLSVYSGSCMADDFCASYTPKTEEDMVKLKSWLRDYTVTDEGEVLWCTFDGIVKGNPSVNRYTPATWKGFDQAGYFSQLEGLKKLKEIKDFWDNREEIGVDWRLENPLRQISSSEVFLRFALIKNNVYTEDGLDKIEKVKGVKSKS